MLVFDKALSTSNIISYQPQKSVRILSIHRSRYVANAVVFKLKIVSVFLQFLTIFISSIFLIQAKNQLFQRGVYFGSHCKDIHVNLFNRADGRGCEYRLRVEWRQRSYCLDKQVASSSSFFMSGSLYILSHQYSAKILSLSFASATFCIVHLVCGFYCILAHVVHNGKEAVLRTVVFVAPHFEVIRFF